MSQVPKENPGRDRLLAEIYEYLENIFYIVIGLIPPILRRLIFKVIFSEFGRGNKIGENCIFRYPWKIQIGDKVEIGYGARIFPSFKIKSAFVKIEDEVVIAPGLTIFGAGHPTSNTHEFHVAESITIGRKAYIGGNVTIRYGVTIGENAVVGAGSIVVKDVLPGSIVAGNPAAIIS